MADSKRRKRAARRKTSARRKAKHATKYRVNLYKLLAGLLMISLMLFILYSIVNAILIKGAPINAPLTSIVSLATASNKTAKPTSNAKPLGITICIDPGHGFLDVGTISPSYIPFKLYEKDINLSVSLLLRDELQNLGFTVIMTHEDNTSSEEKLSLEDRVNLANRENVDLFISVHTNSYQENLSVQGSRIYYYNSEDNRSEKTSEIANQLKQTINFTFDNSTVIHPLTLEDSFQVNRDAHMPSITFEMGFITNLEDAQNLKDPLWQAKMAKTLAQGIYNSMVDN